jgi:hypothetical protein
MTVVIEHLGHFLLGCVSTSGPKQGIVDRLRASVDFTSISPKRATVRNCGGVVDRRA